MLTRRKVSKSDNGGNCIEVASADGKTFIRDSKRPEAGHLTVTADAWRRLPETAKDAQAA